MPLQPLSAEQLAEWNAAHARPVDQLDAAVAAIRKALPGIGRGRRGPARTHTRQILVKLTEEQYAALLTTMQRLGIRKKSRAIRRALELLDEESRL
jgi:hypothetical protein